MSPAAQGLLLDTRVLAELRSVRPAPRVVAFLRRRAHRPLYLSVLSTGQLRSRWQEEEGHRWLDELEERFGDRVLPVDADVARCWAGRPTPPVDPEAPTELHSVDSQSTPRSADPGATPGAAHRTARAPGHPVGTESEHEAHLEGLLAATAVRHELTVVSAAAARYLAWGVPALDPWTEA